MKVLLTGASSFTGTWFVDRLVAAGHDVHATLTGADADAYAEQGVRTTRVQQVLEQATPIFGCRFGDDTFMDALTSGGFDVLCHHAADVTNYKSPDFDAGAALVNNTRNLAAVLDAFKQGGGSRVVSTQSVFAGGIGAGTRDADGNLPHFSPYGLSKCTTCETIRYYAGEAGLPLGEFVIPNPFGPLEEPRFTNYLVKTWFAGKQAGCNTPAYVRDNIHIGLMARCYAAFVERVGGHGSPAFQRYAPTGYAETQGAFAQRFAAAFRERTDLACDLELAHQTEFTEPLVRINTDPADADALGFDESAAWDDVVAYYRGLYGG